MEPSVSAPLCAVGPPWSVPLTLYLCKAFLSVLSGWPGGAGAGSLLSLCGWPGGSLPSQWTGEQETFGVSTSGLVNICIVCLFFNYGRDSESPQQNRSPLSPRNILHTLSLARRSRQGLPHPGQSPMCLVQEPSAPEMGPAEGTTATQQEGGPHPVPFAPPPAPLPPPLRLPGDEGVQLTSPPFLQQRSGVGPTRLLLLSPASPHLALSGPASLSRFSKDQKQANKKIKK